MALSVVIIVLLSVASHQIVDGCIPTPNIDDNVMFPLPTTMTPVVPVPCSQCLTPLKFLDICESIKIGTCSSENVIHVECVECTASTRNGDMGPFIPTMMASIDVICDNSGNYYFGTPNNVVTTIRCN
uniref:Uncharacterized protein n=1 Tax=Panagrolaimus davidi TaxID=227884 RepID=A0A914PMM2_9BILA